MPNVPSDIIHLVQQYEKDINHLTASTTWYEACEFLDIVDYYEKENRRTDAEFCLRIALKLYPNDSEVLMHKVYWLKNEGKWHEAISTIQQIENPNPIDTMFLMAEKSLSELNYEEAETVFQQIVEAENEAPDTDKLYIEIAELYLDYGGVCRAIPYLNKIAPESNSYKVAQNMLAEIYYQLGEFEKSKSTLEKLLDADPYNIDAWMLLADLCFDNAENNKTLEACDYILAISPHNERALKLKVLSHFAKMENEEGIKAYDAYEQICPNDYSVALKAGEIYLNINQTDKALEFLSKANRCCPNDNTDKLRILIDIATVYSLKGCMATAFEILLSSCSLGQHYEDVVMQLISLGCACGYPEYGINIMDNYLKQHRNQTPEFKMKLSKILYEHQCFDKARDIWTYFFHSLSFETGNCAPYVAYAAYKLKLSQLFSQWIRAAVIYDKATTYALFCNVYPTLIPDQYIAKADEDTFS